MKKRVLVNGACGRMGQEVVKTIVLERDDLLVGVCDQVNIGRNLMDLLGLEAEELIIKGDLRQLIEETRPDVIIDFTTPTVVMDNIRIGLASGVDMIVGTTGITEVDLESIDKLARENKANILIAPNFALGAVLMMRFAAEAAKYIYDVEIIELHHDQKLDSPSGTAIKTAELIKQNRKEMRVIEQEEIEKITGARGADAEGIKIHSVRLPGLVAHQEVIFGAEGQSLSIRHDSYNRKSFMPGVKLALDKIDQISGLVYGLEHLLA
ncbi:MAG TPA: 4-hydroxy-tetrahydrodipicolinate reductase [Halanaerobiaceae bacterium]|jgi:4-hydroxy-tetrahydrodipicolinate reductase|nr:4-hydroxy-tetrahydrodipicolinate reductase [Bacillota bacterium]HHU93209.1 4-hydroxy-tetrahydrodipicolinate reductase [Halanaerobiaceae bacterium]HOA41291.1 4-hydroxy-tetrahydrodipicolinate reductase [Halanaerobiales bacterium]HPZ62517.1 4-hydroxy-tetrahydrodipicolinate reductase [Halanaerobiales bacterium]HQD03736.1 4-hydroxy-tetrahydrodipicolinate reductase [Halanaerobiales bacterium]